jgi:hypothetical protein
MITSSKIQSLVSHSSFISPPSFSLSSPLPSTPLSPPLSPHPAFSYETHLQLDSPPPGTNYTGLIQSGPNFSIWAVIEAVFFIILFPPTLILFYIRRKTFPITHKTPSLSLFTGTMYFFVCLLDTSVQYYYPNYVPCAVNFILNLFAIFNGLFFIFYRALYLLFRVEREKYLADIEESNKRVASDTDITLKILLKTLTFDESSIVSMSGTNTGPFSMKRVDRHLSTGDFVVPLDLATPLPNTKEVDNCSIDLIEKQENTTNAAVNFSADYNNHINHSLSPLSVSHTDRDRIPSKVRPAAYIESILPSTVEFSTLSTPPSAQKLVFLRRQQSSSLIKNDRSSNNVYNNLVEDTRLILRT